MNFTMGKELMTEEYVHAAYILLHAGLLSSGLSTLFSLLVAGHLSLITPLSFRYINSRTLDLNDCARRSEPTEARGFEAEKYSSNIKSRLIFLVKRVISMHKIRSVD